MKRINMAGQRYGRLVVLEMLGVRNAVTYVKALCECGSVCELRGACLRNGATRSCGCLQRESKASRATIHGRSKSGGAYTTWMQMRGRCNNPNHPNFQDYGLRGITVCDRWDSFENFLSDMGERPPGMTIERMNNDLGYSPENCKWVGRQEQAKNRRSTLLISIDGREQCLKEWCAILGVKRHVVTQLRKRYHLSAKDALLRAVKAEGAEA